MDVEINPTVSFDPITSNSTEITEEITFKKIVEYLINDKNVYLKHQQRDESELTFDEKKEIIENIFGKGPDTFLLRFGKYLKPEHLMFFTKFENDSKEIKSILHNLTKANDKKSKLTRNRRFVALRKMIDENSYFSETEMMKRSPLMYEQLVGQYLSSEEKNKRDRELGKNTLVEIIMEGLERNEAEIKQKKEELEEVDDSRDENSSEEEKESNDQSIMNLNSTNISSNQPSCSLWGEYTNQNVSTASWGEITKPSSSRKQKSKQNVSAMITATERQLFKEEFITTMYENFLEGKDEDFDYKSIDENEEYDNLEMIDRDEEDKYFDSESPEDTQMENDEENKQYENDNSSEDELDIYMNALKQHPTVSQLSKGIEKL